MKWKVLDQRKTNKIVKSPRELNLKMRKRLQLASPEYKCLPRVLHTNFTINAFLSTCSPGWWKHSRRVSPNGQTRSILPMHSSIIFVITQSIFMLLLWTPVLHNNKTEDPVFVFTDVFPSPGRDGTCTLQMRTNILCPPLS